jgi:hypothetical protein
MALSTSLCQATAENRTADFPSDQQVQHQVVGVHFDATDRLRSGADIGDSQGVGDAVD